MENEKNKNKKSKKILKIILIVIGILFLLFVALCIFSYFYINAKIEKATKELEKQQEARNAALAFVDAYISSGKTYLSDFAEVYDGKICETLSDRDCGYFRNGLATDDNVEGYLSTIIFYYNQDGYTISTNKIGTTGSWLAVKEAILNNKFENKKLSITDSGDALEYPPVGN